MEQIFRKYLNSVLLPDEFERVSGFLADKNNEHIVSELMKPFWEKAMLEDTEFQKSNPELRDKLLQAVLLSENARTRKKLSFYNYSLKIAAVFLIALTISSVYFYQETKQNQPISETRTIETPWGAKTSFTLPDGSQVWLNSGSSVSYSHAFGEIRGVKLNGEAFFEVKKNQAPFIVETQYGNVEVKGTSFNVKAFSEENFQATLTSGIVKVVDIQSGKAVVLHPGQQAEKEGDKFSIEEVEPDLFSSWKDGKLVFRDEFLPVVAKRLSRWYNVKIELSDDKRLSEISFTGTIEMESFSEVLQLLKITAPITYVYKEETRTIKIRYKEPI